MLFKKKNGSAVATLEQDNDIELIGEESEITKIENPVSSGGVIGKRNREKKEKETVLSSGGEERFDNLFGEDRKTVSELVAFEGINTFPLDHVDLFNAGFTIPTVCMYIHKTPRTTTFASSYVPLFNFSGVMTSVFIDPMSHDKAQKIVDQRVSDLDVQLSEAKDAGDINRARKLNTKYKEANAWAAAIEKGDNALFNVQFLFTVQDINLDELQRKVNLFHAKATEIGFDVVCCYATHALALKSQFPLNKVFSEKKDTDMIKTHVLDKNALLDIFNHTENSFIHKDGVFAGHYINGNKLFLYDMYDKSHNGYGVVIAGGTGTGKSATIKMLQSRWSHFGVRFRTIDVDSKANEGEYAGIARELGGINFEIKTGSKNILNPFDINVEYEYDTRTGMEFPVLHLNEKLVYLEDLFLSMVMTDNAVPEVALERAMRAIIISVCSELYEERGIYDGRPESLYTTEDTAFLSSGKSKKVLPTITDAYKKILMRRHLNKNKLHEQAYQTLIDSISDRVKEVYYGVDTCHFLSREEYESLPQNEYGRRIRKTRSGEMEEVLAIRGAKSYFDGQSTMSATTETPYINYDISQVPTADKAFALLVVMGYMEENDVRRNSANQNNIQKLVVLLDELHTVFPYKEARRIVERFYRTARKRHVSPWSATQSLKDYGGYPETEAILKNADSIFLFRHTELDREYLRANTSLNASQVERVLVLGVDPKDVDVSEEEANRKRGEVCIIDKGRPAFVKIDYLRETEAGFVETDASKYAINKAS